MRRSALATFFQRLVVATLPIAGACHDGGKPPADGGAGAPQDLAVAVMDDFAFASPDLYDSCEVNFPVTRVNNDPAKLPDGGFPTQCLAGSACSAFCPAGYMLCCAPTASDGGAVIIDCSLPCPGGGRRPEGLAAVTAHGSTAGDYFAAMAHLEAASVTAFRRLGRELRHHGAPARLVSATSRALADEVRHARTMRAFAAAEGRAPATVTVARFRPRPLEEIARENMAEGCVRETFGALIATWQSRSARDRRFAAAMKTIARDETSHAELSWAVAAFCNERLAPSARRRVRESRDGAVATLADEIGHAWPAPFAARVGLPDRAHARRLFSATRRALWS